MALRRLFRRIRPHLRSRPAPMPPPEIDEEYRRRFLEEYNAAYERLRADPVAWNELLKERADWDAVLLDGLDREPPEDEEPA